MGPFETKRLILRQMKPEDVPILQTLIYAEPQVWGLYSSLGDKPVELASRFVYFCHQPLSSEFGRLVVVLKETQQPIGQIHLDPYVNDTHLIPGDPRQPFRQIEVELAFAFGKAFWGQGLAYEACQTLIEYAFKTLRLPRLVGGILDGNHRSIKLHQRLGYTVYPNTHPKYPDGWVAILENPFLGS
jgi:RimJ/RimL family protein N-acetyltransferase